ncbi:hypothetical protein V500_07781 [Pseudogymnoascus sp. VKM F-4518 (FW-2643)]|nr:hypothetical protein V500_07781 [Pseudogymnoascus sp. VKM F-4518 (FW-2643)]
MKFFAAAIALLPLAAFANPVPNDAPITDISVLRQREAERLGLAPRDVKCCDFVKVTSPTTVKCRSGPGTQYKIVKTYPASGRECYSCYESGTCINGNCSWDYNYMDNCYISGYYTGSACTTAALGKCNW